MGADWEVHDDSHRASLLLLQFVAHELHHAPILIVGTYWEVEARQAAEVMGVLHGNHVVSNPMGRNCVNDD